MPRLTDIKIEKISFVRRAANKRKFLLLKSADVTSDPSNTNPSPPETEEVIVDEKLKKALAAICKQERDPKKVIDLLKSDQYPDVEVTEEVEKSVQDALALQQAIAAQPPPKADPPAEPTAKADKADPDVATVLKSQQKELEELRKANEQLQKAAVIREESEWLATNAPLASGSRDDLAARLTRLKKSDEDAYTAYRDALKSESAANDRSQVFAEVGTSASGAEAGDVGAEIFPALEKSRDELRKSADGLTPEADLNAIRSAVKKAGPGAFDRYTDRHAQRARRLGGGNVPTS